VGDLFAGECARCGFELTTSPTISLAADEFGLFSQAIIRSWFDLRSPASSQDSPKLPDQPPAILYCLLDGFRRTIMKIRTGWTYLYQSPCQLESVFFPVRGKADLTPPNAYLLYTTAFRGLLNWPQGFYEFLEAYRGRDGREAGSSIPRELGSLYYRWLEGHWKSTPFRFVQETFDQYLLHYYTHSPSLFRVQRNFAFRLQMPYLSSEDAAKILGTEVGLIKHLVRAKFLVGHAGEGWPQSLNLVRRTEVLELQAKWQGLVPVAAVAKILGLSEDVVLDLIKAGLLEVISGGIGANRGQVSYQSLIDFILRVQASQKWYVNPYLIWESTSLIQATQELLPYGFGTVDLIQHVLQREVRAYGMGEAEGLDRLQLLDHDLGILLEGARANRLLLMDEQVSNMIQVDQSIIAGWVTRGLLTPVREVGQALYFDRDQVWSFISRQNLCSVKFQHISGVG
jgi:hypothetical protein